MQDKLRILLTRTDSIGDVVLTLPMAGFLKKHLPNCQVFFLGRTYTKAVIELSEHVDGFINYDDILKMDQVERINKLRYFRFDTVVHVFPVKEIAELFRSVGVNTRVGTRNRIWHWYTCNKLIKLSRKNSNLHEAQLNMQLLSFLGFDTAVALDEIRNYYGFTKLAKLKGNTFVDMLDNSKTKVILHPRSKGSAKEWGLANFAKLIEQLPQDKFQIFISGTKEDGMQLQSFLAQNPRAIDLTGKFSLEEFISFINECDVLVAASTGPLHIAAALDKKAIGLFSPMRPIHPGRWSPLGKNAHALVFDENCEQCRAKKNCDCIEKIEVQKVVNLIEAK